MHVRPEGWGRSYSPDRKVLFPFVSSMAYTRYCIETLIRIHVVFHSRATLSDGWEHSGAQEVGVDRSRISTTLTAWGYGSRMGVGNWCMSFVLLWPGLGRGPPCSKDVVIKPIEPTLRDA